MYSLDPSEVILPLMVFFLIPGGISTDRSLGGIPLYGLTVSKKSSNWMWKPGDKIPVCRFRASATEAT